MKCEGCGNEHAYRTQSGFYKNEDGNRVPYECCDRCGDTNSGALPDVFWDGSPEYGLANDPRTGQPRTFSSKMEKARYLKERNLIEAGGGWHGSKTALPTESQVARGMSVAEAKAQAMQMGKTKRREIIWKMLKETKYA